VIRSQVSLKSFRSCASYENLPAYIRRSNGSLPLEKPCLMPSEVLVRSQTACSLGPFVLAGSPFAEPRKKHLPSLSPSRPSRPPLLPTMNCGTPGLVLSATWLLPPKRAPTCWDFPTDRRTLPLKKSTLRGLFFHLSAPKTLANSQTILCADNDLPPKGR